MAAHPRPGTAVADATKRPRRKDIARSLDRQCFYTHPKILVCIHVPVGPVKRMERGRSRHGDGTLHEIAGLWERTSASGRAYIGGRTPDNEDIVLPAGSMSWCSRTRALIPAHQPSGFCLRRADQPHRPTDPGSVAPARQKAGGGTIAPAGVPVEGHQPRGRDRTARHSRGRRGPPVLDPAPRCRQPSPKPERKETIFAPAATTATLSHTAGAWVPPLPRCILASIGKRSAVTTTKPRISARWTAVRDGRPIDLGAVEREHSMPATF